jgi:hypothetical protein
MDPLEKFLSDVHEIHASRAAVDETPYYGALETLLNEVGKNLKPRVRCIIHPKDRGAGLPDGGLFTADQFDKKSGHEPKEGQLPSRGAIEVKPPKEDASRVALGDQVTRYLARYRQALVTNLRQFVLAGHDAEGRPTILEKYEMTDTEASFWKAAAHPRSTDGTHGIRLAEYLKRVMLHPAPLATPEDVAFFLASYARDALARIEGVELDALAAVRSALEEALGLKFEGQKGDHFFHSSLVQTLFYGVFSAWVLWARQRAPAAKDRFDWNQTARLLKVPVIRKLFHEMADPGQLEELNLTEVLDWTAGVLNRVDRASFFSKFQESQAIQYFYEPFLEEFDPELRKELGVWYTPHEIVKYMVERVDTVLREELHLPDGLADKNVYVLDPCCGTGSYLVEVLKKIHETLSERSGDALTAADLKEAAQNRVFGFEILPAPFVVSHLQLGLLLQQLGAPLAERGDERIGVYLTNALTGWEPPKGPKQHLIFPELEEERDAAEHVKRETPILVILGNPPYNAFAGLSPAEEQGLVEPYKEGLVEEWKIKKFNLDDLYVRFFRLAERRIAEMTGRGVVSYISNHSWISDPSFVVLRQHLLQSFDLFWIENMHGNRKISEYAPDGRTSETIFAIPRFSPGIQQGVAISLWVKNGNQTARGGVQFREDLNDARAAERRAKLLDSLTDPHRDAHYLPAQPTASNRFSFRPQTVTPSYKSWPALDDLPETSPSLGILENRQEALINVDKLPLEQSMKGYFDPENEWETLRKLGHQLTKEFARFDPEKARRTLLAEDDFSTAAIRRLTVRPMDVRWCYYTDVRPLWNEPRPDYVKQMWEGNRALMSRRKGVANPEGVPFFFTSSIGYQHSLNTDAYFVPLRIKTFPKRRKDRKTMHILDASQPRANLSERARSYLRELGIDNLDADEQHGSTLWMHVLAIGYSQAYLSQNADGIRQDWPRVPLPKPKEVLAASAALGRQIAALLDTESQVEGVTSGDIRPELRAVGVITRGEGGNLKDLELALEAGWGHAGKGGVTMPGKGTLIEREYSEAERNSLLDGAKALGLTEEQLFHHLGEKTCDVYLNDSAYWSNIPPGVWDYTIGGYQVIKKWLSYREQRVLGRALTKEEVRYVQEMARRIAAILLLEPALDANYEAVKSNTYNWPT